MDHDENPEEQLSLGLRPVELALLEALLREPTLERVAESIGYSERQARRLADELVRRLGVPNRYAAVAMAARVGIIRG